MKSKVTNNIRVPFVSGTFYSDDPSVLFDEIDLFFKNNDVVSDKDRVHVNIEKDSINRDNKNKNVNTVIDKERYLVAGISPHAGYFFSGRCAGSLYKNIKYDTKLIFILGFSHNGYDDDISTTKKDWQTPLGIMQSEDKFIQKLIDEKIAEENDHSLENEHSIEMQVPIIQYMIKKGLINKNVKIIPLSVPRIDFKKKAEKIFDILDRNNTKEGIVFIASSDFTHYGRSFGYTPFQDDVYDSITRLDNGAINLITKAKSKELIEYIDKTKATICGINPILLLIEIIKLFKLKDGRLIEYYKSSDIIKDKNSSVSYASIGFFR